LEVLKEGWVACHPRELEEVLTPPSVWELDLHPLPYLDHHHHPDEELILVVRDR